MSDGVSCLALGASFTVSVVVVDGAWVPHAFVENVVEVVEVGGDVTKAHLVCIVWEAADVSCGSLFTVFIAFTFPDFVESRNNVLDSVDATG